MTDHERWMDPDRCDRIAVYIKEASSEVSFLSEVVIQQEDMDYLLKWTNRILFDTTESESLLILSAYLLVYAGLSYDGDYWIHVSKMTGSTNKIPQCDQDDLRDTFDKGIRLLDFDMSDVVTYRGIDRILMHTLVPDNEAYQDRFFNFIYTFYRDVQGCELPDDMNPVFDELSRIINADKSVQFPNYYPSKYGLNQCTIYALKDPKTYHRLMEKVFKIIDSGCKGYSSGNLGNNRFSVPFKRWYDKNIGSRSKRSLRREMRRRRARLELADSGLNIFIPARPCVSGIVEFRTEKQLIHTEELDCITTSAGGMRRMLRNYSFNTAKIGIHPFDGLDVFMDGTSILSRPRQDWMIFDEDYLEVREPCSGINHILVRDSTIVPNSESTHIDKTDYDNRYLVCFDDGDSLSIAGKTFTVYPLDQSENENGFFIDPVQGVTVRDRTGETFPVLSEFEVRYNLCGLGPTPYAYALARIDDSNPIHIPITINNDSIREDRIYSKLPATSLPLDGIHKFSLELYLLNSKKAVVEFYLLPNYITNFDSEVYVHETNGLLIRTGLFEDFIDFTTNQDCLEIEVPESNVKIIHKIPVVRLSSGDYEWKYPGDFDLKMDDFLGDTLHVDSPVPCTLYCMGKPVDYFGEDPITFELGFIRDQSFLDNCVDIEFSISLNHSPKVHLMNLWICNEYDCSKSKSDIKIHVTRHVDSKVTLELVGMETTVVDVEDDDLVVDLPLDGALDIYAIELSKEGVERRKHILENGKSMYLRKYDGNICVFHSKKKEVLLNCDGLDYKHILDDYDSKCKYSRNSWMKSERSQFINLIKLNGFT